MTSHQIRLRWTSHQPTVVSVFEALMVEESFVDVTLAAQGQFIKAHKVILSACSPYFQELLSLQREEKVIVFLKDVKFSELRALISYIYRGEVNISQEELPSFLKVAESLQIRGLTDVDQRPADPQIPPTQSNQSNPQCSVASESKGVNPVNGSKASLGNSVLNLVGSSPPVLVASSISFETFESEANERITEKRTDKPTGGGQLTKKVKLEEKRGVLDEDEEGGALGPLPRDVKAEESPPFLEDEEEEGDEMPNLPHEADFKEEFGGNWMDENNSNPEVFDTTDGGKTCEVFECKTCGRVYKRSSTLVRHQTYECNQAPRFACSICGFRMKLKTNLNAHERRCRSKRSFQDQVT